MGNLKTDSNPWMQFADNLLVVGNDRILLGIEINDHASPSVILDMASGRYYADADYHYEISINKKYISRQLKIENFSHRILPDQSLEIILCGKPEFTGKGAPQDLIIFHSFIVPPDGAFIEENITIMNTGGNNYKVDNIRFGFRKKLFANKIAKGFSNFKLYSLPFQRYWGQRLDRKHDVFTMDTLVKSNNDIPGYASEGWMLTDKKNGFLITKYCPDLIEFSLLDRQKSKTHVDLTFGGAGLYRRDPEEATELEPWSQIDFGTTRYELFNGGFEQGCYTFRNFMDSRGHVPPRRYKPRIFWNVLYNLECSLTDPTIKPYSFKQLMREAELAKEMGCEALYLDPQWDTLMGSTVWDTKRLGTQKRFVQTLRKKYGLELALHMMMNTDSADEYKGLYRVNKKGGPHTWSKRLYMICPPTEWKEIKKKRIAKLCKDGAHWIMFDFTDLDAGTECWCEDHPHHLPLRRSEHANAIYEVITHIKEKYPDVMIESHDRITSGPQDYHQMYYQHTGPHTFDEGWAFEMMWDSMGDLVSGKAFTLYSYRMCYSLPQYLHFNLSNDNDNLLCFWWFASTVQHIGVGGISDENSPRYKKAKKEMKTYRRLCDFYVRGTFYGINPTCHVHTLPGRNRAVINLFNLTKKTKTIKETIDLTAIGLDPKNVKSLKGADFKKKGNLLTFILTLPPLSPGILELK